jgi:hypothetical protein
MRRICASRLSSAHSSWRTSVARPLARGAAPLRTPARWRAASWHGARPAPRCARWRPLRRAKAPPAAGRGRTRSPGAGGELRLVQALQAGVGAFQRDDRGFHVARQLQLLGGGQQHLLDLGQRPLVAPLRQILVERLERQLLLLRRRHLAFDVAEPFADLPHRIVGIAREQTGFAHLLAGLGEPAPQFGLQVADAFAAVGPRPGRGIASASAAISRATSATGENAAGLAVGAGVAAGGATGWGMELAGISFMNVS